VRNILIVDDEPYVRTALRRVLLGSGNSVVTAANAEEGLQQLRQGAADLAIVDIIIPGLDGVELIAQIRSQFPNVRVIAMTGGGNFGLSEYLPDTIITHAYLEAAKKAGAQGVLFKPFETQQLRDLIERVAAPAPAEAH